MANPKFENVERLDMIGIFYECGFNTEQAAEVYLDR